jgi:hypothetical protein
MNLVELKAELDRAGVDPEAYSLEGRHLHESYVLERGVGGWFIYYSERGKRTDEQFFGTEDAACRYLFEWVITDPSTRRRSDGNGPKRRIGD